MHEDIASLVYPVVNRGLELWERLDGGEMPDIDAEQAILKDLLLVEASAQRRTEFDGDSFRAHGDLTARQRSASQQRDAGQLFLGIRYALVCWLDEIFTCNSPWSARWNEQKLEMELYGTNDRAWMFWQQSHIAQTRIGSSGFEVFFLCAMLGFRGELRDRPDQLRTWFVNAKHRLGAIQDMAWPYASELEPPARVPPLRGREVLQRMILAGWGVVLLTVVSIAFLLVYRFGQ